MPHRISCCVRPCGAPSAAVCHCGSGMLYRWAPERPARVGVLPREGTAADIRWFDVQPCFVFHPLNAFDDGDRIVLDVVRHPSVFTTAYDYVAETQSLDRWTVDLPAGKVTEQRFDDTAQEFPRVDERLVGLPPPVWLRGGVRVRSGMARGSHLTPCSSTTSTTGPPAR